LFKEGRTIRKLCPIRPGGEGAKGDKGIVEIIIRLAREGGTNNEGTKFWRKGQGLPAGGKSMSYMNRYPEREEGVPRREREQREARSHNIRKGNEAQGAGSRRTIHGG